MPNYKLGFAATGGVQFKLNDRFSLAAEAGIMISTGWIYDGYYLNDLHWVINDTITGELLAEGDNYLDIFNYSLGIRPKYYFMPDSKICPYFFTGINLNLTRSFFDNTEWAALKHLGWLGVEDVVPYNDNLESSLGIGLYPGLGIEYSPNDRFYFYFESGYYVISLKKKNFKDPAREENFNAVLFQVGLRMNFIKSKEL
jgi:opacity protein-like surface antigen